MYCHPTALISATITLYWLMQVMLGDSLVEINAEPVSDMAKPGLLSTEMLGAGRHALTIVSAPHLCRMVEH
jgi:hypothetical protein